ncbi:MAG: ribonuclease HII [Candidatus Binatota bacterium]
MKRSRGERRLFHPSSLEAGRFEEEGYARGFKYVAGLDEVGRGPWAGPVVAAAVILPREFLVSGFALGTTRSFDGLRIDPEQGRRVETRDSKLEIKDSKLLTARKREQLAPLIKEKALAWGLGVVGPEEIDRINILNASLLAMAMAFKQIQPLPDCLLIDGPHEIPRSFLVDSLIRYSKDEYTGNEYTNNALPFQRAIKKGDRLSISIAAASIVAKVARDQMMVEYDRLYPEYGFGRHKGYGSPAHWAALNRYGPSPIHRRSFRPVRECLG